MPAAHPVDVVHGVGHGLHPAGDDALLVPRADRLRGEHHGLEAGAAHLVDRECRDGAGESRVDRGLAGGCLPHPALQHVPHDDFVHRGGIDPRATHGFTNDAGAELWRGERSEPAQIAPDRRADRTEDDGGGGVGAHVGYGRGMTLPLPHTNDGNARVRISSVSRPRNSSTGMTTCLLPAPRARTATVPACASRSPTTARYGTFCTSPSRTL